MTPLIILPSGVLVGMATLVVISPTPAAAAALAVAALLWGVVAFVGVEAAKADLAEVPPPLELGRLVALEAAHAATAKQLDSLRTQVNMGKLGR